MVKVKRPHLNQGVGMVYDCFIFFNEFEQLNIRLHELNPIVDRFVLVESNQTFSGNMKPLYFAENRERWSMFLDKIIHVVVDDMPKLNNGNRWELEHHQRKCITRGLNNCAPNDIIVISDVDEIPDPELLCTVVNNLLNVNIITKSRELLAKHFPFRFSEPQTFNGLTVPAGDGIGNN